MANDYEDLYNAYWQAAEAVHDAHLEAHKRNHMELAEALKAAWRGMDVTHIRGLEVKDSE